MRGRIVSFGLPIAAQVVASGSSLIISVAAARGLSVSEFGLFAVLFAAYSLSLGVVRALTSEVLVYKHSAIIPKEFVGAAGASASAVIMLSAVLTVAYVVFGMSGIGDWRVYIFMGAGIIPLFFREHMRVVLTIQKRGGLALCLEGVYIALMSPALHHSFSSDMASILLIWSAAAWVTAVVAFVLVRIPLSMSGGVFWLRSERREGSFYAGDFLVTNGMNQGSVFLVAAIGTVTASAAIRSVQVLLTPILLVTRGLFVAIGPEARRAAAACNWSLLWRLSVGYALSVTVMCAIALFAVTTIPEPWIRLLLGDSTRLAVDLFLPAALAVTTLGVASGAALGLRALGEIKTTFKWKILSAPVSLMSVLFGTILAGAPGSQLGLATGELVRGSANWYLLRKNLVNGTGSKG